MQHDNISVSHQVWYDSAHASLCVLGVHLRRIHFFRPWSSRCRSQKVLKYTPLQKL